MGMVQSLPKRSEVKIEETWNLKDLFASEKEYKDAYAEIEKNVPVFVEKYKGN